MIELLSGLFAVVLTLIGAVFSLAMAFIPFLGILAIATVVAKSAQQSRMRRLQRLAEAWGLKAVGSQLVGRLDEVEVQLEERREGGKHKKTYTYFRWSLPGPWKRLLNVRDENVFDAFGDLLGGSDIEIGDKKLDDRLRIAGCPRTARAVLLDPEVRKAYLNLRRFGGLKLTGGRLELRSRGGLQADQGVLVSAGVRLARAFEDARIRPWQRAADALGLSLSDSGRRLDGFFGEHRVEVRQDDGPPPKTTIRVPLYRALPDGTRIARTGEGESARLGDPILDSAVHVTGNPLTLGPLLCTDETRALLMTVVHGFPGSVVTDTEIALQAKGRLMDELEQAIRDAVMLARRLSQRPAQSDPAATRREDRTRESS